MIATLGCGWPRRAASSAWPAPTRTRVSGSASAPIRTRRHVTCRCRATKSSFRAFSNHVVLDGPLSGDAVADAAALLDAIRQGRVFTVIDGWPRRAASTSRRPAAIASAQMGERPADRRRRARCARASSAPPGTTLVLLRDGQRVHEVTDGELEADVGDEPGVYRIEAYIAGAPGAPPVPWMVSNPDLCRARDRDSRRRQIAESRCRAYRRASPRPPPRSGPATRAPSPCQPDRPGRDRGRSRRSPGRLRWRRDARAGSSRRVQIPVDGGLAAFDRVRFTRRCRIGRCACGCSCARRSATTERWGRTFYADDRAAHRRAARSTASSRSASTSSAAAAARQGRLAAVRGRYAEHAAGQRTRHDLDVAFVATVGLRERQTVKPQPQPQCRTSVAVTLSSQISSAIPSPSSPPPARATHSASVTPHGAVAAVLERADHLDEAGRKHDQRRRPGTRCPR